MMTKNDWLDQLRGAFPIWFIENKHESITEDQEIFCLATILTLLDIMAAATTYLAIREFYKLLF